MDGHPELNAGNFSRGKRQVIRIRGSNEMERKRECLMTPSRVENSYSRNMESRRGLSRNSRQAAKPTVNWRRGKIISGSLQGMFEGNFQPINLKDLGILDGANPDKEGERKKDLPNPDHFRYLPSK